jgi:hypothetical protein
MIDVYSVPCDPATNASTGPGLAPFITATGMLNAASLPAGTSMLPVAFCPRAAAALPTVKVCAAVIPTNNDMSINAAEVIRFIDF